MIQPEMWSRHSEFCGRATKFYLDKYKDSFNWKNNEAILEFGIGDGNNSRTSLWPCLPKNLKEYIGSDISRVMVEHVKKLAVNDKMKFMTLDIACPNISNDLVGRFDHIFSFFAMHWVQNTRQAFLNMNEMMKHGGELFLIFAERTSVDEVYNFLSEHPKWAKFNHERLFSPFCFSENPQKEYENALCEAGIRNYSLEVEECSYAFPSEKSFEEFFYSVNPIIEEVPEEDREEYKQLYMEKTKRNTMNWATVCEKTGKEVFHTSYKAFIIFARKAFQ